VPESTQINKMPWVTAAMFLLSYNNTISVLTLKSVGNNIEQELTLVGQRTPQQPHDGLKGRVRKAHCKWAAALLRKGTKLHSTELQCRFHCCYAPDPKPFPTRFHSAAITYTAHTTMNLSHQQSNIISPSILLFFPSLMCRLTQGSFSRGRNMKTTSAAGVFQEFSYVIMLCHVALGFHNRQEVLTSVSDNATLFMESKERITCGIHPSPLLWQNPVLGNRRPRAKD
jgi:hypothetical protein